MGQVVGFSSTKRDGAESRAFMWSSQTGMIDIGTLGGGYAQACAINDAGVVTGSSQTQGMGAMLATHAFIYRQPSPSNQRMQDLGVLGWLFQFWNGHQQLQPCCWLFDRQKQQPTRSCVFP